MSPKKSNRKTKVSSKIKKPAAKAKPSDIAAAKRKRIAKKIATKLRPTNTSLILESMKRRLKERREEKPLLKKEPVVIRTHEEEEESEAKRILRKIMEEREAQGEKKNKESAGTGENEENDDAEEEIPIEIPEIEEIPPEEKTEEEKEEIEAEKEEKEVDEAKARKEEEKAEEEPTEQERKMEEKKAPQEEEEEKEMKRFFEPKAQEAQSRPMPIIPETEAYPAQQKAEERFNWTRLIIALISAVVLAAAAGYGFTSLGYGVMSVFGGSLLVLVASTAYFYIVLKNMGQA